MMPFIKCPIKTDDMKSDTTNIREKESLLRSCFFEQFLKQECVQMFMYGRQMYELFSCCVTNSFFLKQVV
jgi:hypothetical protein